jgi:HK97 family phage major capsid protein
MDPIEELQNRLAELSAATQQILDIADQAARDLTDEETAQIEANNKEYAARQKELTLRQNVRAQQQQQQQNAAGQGRRTDPEDPSNANPVNPRQAARGGNGGNGGRWVAPANARNPAQNGGFDTFGQYLMAVRHASNPGSIVDQRLTALASGGSTGAASRPRQDTTAIFSNETAGADGGFAVPADFRNALISRVFGEDSLLSRCDQMVTASNSVTMPVDIDEVWNDNTGIYARWENEGGIKPESKLALDQMTIRLNKLVALVPVSDELLEDAPAIESYIRRKAPDKINFKVSRGIVAGSGVGQPLGLLKAGAKIQVDAGAAPSGSIQFAHIKDMYGRMFGPFRNNAVWLVNPELDAQLMGMFFSTAPVATTPATPIPVYLPANSVANQPYATLFGRPVIPTQACEPLGTEGDIIFADLSQYLALVKSGVIRTDVSIHVYFVQDLTAFRFVMRIGGMPWIPAPYTPRVGTFTQSPFITLEGR